MLNCHKDKVVLLDLINGNCDLDQTRACLERTLNPVVEQSTIATDEVKSFSKSKFEFILSIIGNNSFAMLGWWPHSRSYSSLSSFHNE